jgi:hypothetical protein
MNKRSFVWRVLIGLIMVGGLVGCGGGDSSSGGGTTSPQPSGSGYLTGKWSGLLARPTGGGANSISYSLFPQKWIINHQGESVTVVHYTTGNSTENGKISTVGGKPHLIIYSNPSIDLIIEPNHNTLTNSWQPNGNGGSLTRD